MKLFRAWLFLVIYLTTAPALAHVVLASPANRATVVVGEAVTITWVDVVLHEGIGYDLEYAGAPLARGLSTRTHSYTWVPTAPCAECLLRVTQINEAEDYFAEIAVTVAPPLDGSGGTGTGGARAVGGSAGATSGGVASSASGGSATGGSATGGTATSSPPMGGTAGAPMAPGSGSDDAASPTISAGGRAGSVAQADGAGGADGSGAGEANGQGSEEIEAGRPAVPDIGAAASDVTCGVGRGTARGAWLFLLLLVAGARRASLRR